MILDTKGNNINTKLITKYLKENNLSKSKFCKLCNISPLTFKKVMSGSLDFGTVALFKISSTIGVRMHEMFE